MSIVIDTTQSPTSQAMWNAGVVAVCRYLSLRQPNTDFKRIGQAEFDRLIGDGFGLVLNWEYAARDWMGGAIAGQSHGQQAAHQAESMGYAKGCAIAGSADFDMSRSEWDAAGGSYAVAYAQAVIAGGYVPGVYGPYDVLTWCRDVGQGFGMYWQSMSTAHSGGRNANLWPGASIWQRGHLNLGGQDVDYNEIHGDYRAMVGAGPRPVPVPAADVLTVDGVLGVHTVSAWQRRMGTPVDGVITQPPGRSSLVAALQRYLNAKIGAGLAVDGVGINQDGHTSYQTQRALQRYLRTPVDGVLSRPVSTCISELQRRLNAATF